MTATLVTYDAARAALQKAARVDEVKDIRDKAIALAAYARQAKDEDMARWVAEIKARAEWRAGEMLAEMAERGERQTKKGVSSRNDTPLPKLNDLGVSRNQASDWQKIATIPEAKFERVLAAAERPITTKALLLQVPKPATSKTGVAQPKDDSEFLAARDKRRATAARFIALGYEAAKVKDGDSAHFRTVRDDLLDYAKRLA